MDGTAQWTTLRLPRGYGWATSIPDLAAIEPGKPQWLQGRDRAPGATDQPFSCKILPPGGLLKIEMKHDLADPGTDSVPLTRHSLLSRLRDWQDQEGWQIIQHLWQIIYNVARKAGLNEVEAQDVVQETFIYLSRRMPKFQYDRARGSFKSWLRVVTRSRINVYRRTEKADEKFIRETIPRQCRQWGRRDGSRA